MLIEASTDCLLYYPLIGGISEAIPLCISPLILLRLELYTDGNKEEQSSMSEISGKSGRSREEGLVFL